MREFPDLRKIRRNLQVLNKVRSKFTYNGKANLEALEEFLSGHRSVQRFIDNLDKAEELFAGIGVKHWGGIKSSGEVRLVAIDNGKELVGGKVDNGVFNVTAPHSTRPAPNTYLTQEYIDGHLAKFDEAAFIFTTDDVADPTYQAFNPNKYVMLRSDMDNLLARFNATKDVSIIESGVGYKPGSVGGKKDLCQVSRKTESRNAGR